MRLYTSNFACAGNNKYAISISRYSPRWYTGNICKFLYPPSDMIKDKESTKEEWTKHYEERVLNNVNRKLLIQGFKDGSILLCYEKRTDFCHRFIVAKWLEKSNKIDRIVELRNREEVSLAQSYNDYLEYPYCKEKEKIRIYIQERTTEELRQYLQIELYCGVV